MAAPREIPGFYFNVEKNRYFPIKDPIPGRIRRLAHTVAVEEATSSSSSSHSPSSSREHGKAKKGCHVNITHKGRRTRVSDLLQFRELYGRLLMFSENRCFFEQECDKLLVSRSLVWKYKNTDLLSDSALEQFNAPIQTPEGQKETDVLLMGSKGGSFSLYGVGNLGHHLGYRFNSTPWPVFPVNMKRKSEWSIPPGNIWTSTGVSTRFPSSVSSILKIGAYSRGIADQNPCQNALVTTLGSGDLGGSVYFLNFNEALDFSSNVLGHHRISKISSYDFTIWTSASNSSGTKAALGTNQGAALLNLETGRLSWLYRTKSDIFSQRFDQSGNVVLCGLRNGSILVVDVRQKPSGSRRHFTSSTRDPVESTAEGANMHQRKHHRNWIARRHQLKGDPSFHCASMPSAVCSLVPLHSDEQYFFGSSMDGSIELFDQRLLHRGAVQSYEGHANSHSHLELGVDPSEAFVLSGGEDCYLRIWSIKSGKMLFAENISDSVLKTVCWMPGFQRPSAHGLHADADFHGCDRRMGGAWLGSREGLFYLNRA